MYHSGGIYWWREASQVVLVVKNPPANIGDIRHGFNPWIRKIPWRRQWQPTPVFLPGEFHDRGAWQATVRRVTKSWTWLKQLSLHAYVYMWGGKGAYENSVFSAQFCCESKTALKNIAFFFLKNKYSDSIASRSGSAFGSPDLLSHWGFLPSFLSCTESWRSMRE